MPNYDEINYGMLYSVNPDYMRQIKNDVAASWKDADGLKQPEESTWQSFATEVGAFFNVS